MEIIELDSMEAVKKHGNLWHTFPAYIQRTFGNKAEIIFSRLDYESGKTEGTIRANNGDCFDIFWNGKKYIKTIAE